MENGGRGVYFDMLNGFRRARKNFGVILTFAFLIMYRVSIGKEICLFMSKSVYNFLYSEYWFLKEDTWF